MYRILIGGLFPCWLVLGANQPVKSEAPTTQVKKIDEPRKPLHPNRWRDPLPPGALMRLGTIRFRHPGEIQALAISPDGKIMATGGEKIYLWEMDTGRPIAMLQNPNGRVHILQFAPDGKTLAAAGAGRDAAVRGTGQTVLWDVRTLKPRHTLEHGSWVRCLAFTPDGTTLVVSCGRMDKANFSAWDVASGKESRRLPAWDSVAAVAFSPDGRILAIAEESIVWIRNWRTAREVGRFDAGSRVHALAFAPDGKTLVTGQDGPHFVQQWDVGERKLLREFKGDKKPKNGTASVGAVAFASDGASIASGDWEGTVLLWDARTGKLRAKCPDAAGDTLHHVAFTQDGKTLVHGGESGGIQLLDTSTGRKLHRWDDDQDRLVHMSVSPDGKLLATSGIEGTIRLWDLKEGETVRVLRGYRGLVSSLEFSSDGRALVSAGGGGAVYLWDVSTGRGHKLFEPDCWWSAAAFDLEGAKIVTAEANWRVRIWDRASEKVLMRVQDRARAINSGSLDKLAFSGDGKWIAAFIGPSSTVGHTMLWELAKRSKPQFLGIDDYPTWLRFAPDNRSLVYRDNDAHRMHFIDVATGKEPHPSVITGVVHFTFTTRGRRLVTAHDDATIRIHEQASGLELHRIKGPDCGMWEVAAAPDARTLLTLNRDKTILVWDLAPPAEKKPKEMHQNWADLAGRDGPAGYRAMWALVTDPKRAVKALRAGLPECQQILAKRRQQLPMILAELDDDSFQRREAASTELDELGDEAEPIIRKALANKPSLEVRRRLEKLLAKPPLVPPGELLRGIRAVAVLELIGTPEAREVLETAAKGPAVDRLTKEAKAALERLAKRPKLVP
jgi:WD40 repeat protein